MDREATQLRAVAAILLILISLSGCLGILGWRTSFDGSILNGLEEPVQVHLQVYDVGEDRPIIDRTVSVPARTTETPGE